MLNGAPTMAPAGDVWRDVPEDDDLDIEGCLEELLDGLADRVVDALRADLRDFEETGRMSDLVLDILRRARCLAQADRIIARY